jgi:hypothetical protein
VPVASKAVRINENTPDAALSYYQGLARMTPAELGRERMVLVAVPQTPYTQVRLAMLLGHPRVSRISARAGAARQRAQVQRPGGAALSPLARQVADNYLERLKLEGQLDKQGQQLKDSQRKIGELQDKLDSLADIERTLTPRPRAVGSKR